MKVDGQSNAVDYNIMMNMGNVQQQILPAGKSDQNDGDKTSKAAAVNEQDLQAATQVMNDAMKISNYHLQFKIDKPSGRVQVKVIDSDTDKVIREIPPDQILACSARITEVLNNVAGFLVDERV